MRSRMMPGVLAMLLGWVLMPGLAHAVALGKIEVTSHLGEAFYAEVPLRLEKDEKLSGVSVEIAEPADYRILEVYRDSALNSLRTSIQDDTRGARIKLVSDSAIESPFLNLVLKVHYGNATSFKKYPVFLDLPSAVVSTARPKAEAPAPKPEAAKPEVSKPEQPVAQAAMTQEATPPAKEAPAATEQKPAPAAQAGAAPFKPFSGWARIGRYGPMVYGDTLMTVARRLRVDDRYTIKQVMVALFDKNRDQFDKENMNLIKAGSYLDVPTAKEVAAITPQRARDVVAEQGRKWKALKGEPRYAAVAEAQKTRYSGKVRIGESAVGVPAATAKSDKKMEGEKGVQLPPEDSNKTEAPSTSAVAPAAGEVASADAEAAATQPSAKTEALQQQNEELRQKLQKADENIATLNAKLSSADVAVSDARIKKLELKLARMQTQLDAARQQAAVAAKRGINEWLTYGLGGMAVLLLAVIGYLLRRERPHPAAEPQADTSFEDDFSASASVGMLPPEEDVVPPQIEPEDYDDASQELLPAEDVAPSNEDAGEGVGEDAGDEVAVEDDAPAEADPNVDYVAEADVYMRYGMEDEALRQLHMALRQRNDNVDAHCKLVKLLQVRGDQDALDAAVEAGREGLSGDALARFESEVALLGSEGAGEGEAADDASGGPVDIDQDITEAFSAGDESESSGLDIGVPVDDESETVGEVDLSDSDDAGLDISGLEWSLGGEEETPSADVSTEGTEEETEKSSGADDTDDAVALDMSGLEEEPESAVPAEDDEATDDTVALDISDLEGEWESSAAEEPESAEPAEDEATDETDDAVALDVSGLEGESESAEPAGDGADDESDEADTSGSLDILGLKGDSESSAIDAPEETVAVGDEAADADASDTSISSDMLDLDGEFESAADAAKSDDEAADASGSGEEGEAIDLDLSSLMLDEDAVETEREKPAVASSDEAQDQQDYNVSQELDDLLDELGIDADEGEGASRDDGVAAGSLAIDMARSLVAQGQLDDAEATFQSALEGDYRCQGLLGMADVAQQRGDTEKAAEMLTQAEALLDDDSREWFERLQEKQGE